MAVVRMLVVGRGNLAKRLAEYFDAEHEHIDITDAAAVERAIKIHKPDVVFNAAAKTNTNQLEHIEYQPEAFCVNVGGPAILIRSARSHGFKLVHFSTGMMFDGAGPTGDGWRESDIPDPVSYYAWTKAWADALLTPSCTSDGTLILRLHLPISSRPGPKNLLSKLPNFGNALNEASSMTVVEDLLYATKKLIENDCSGIFNIVNPGAISLLEVVELLKKNGLIPAEKNVEAISKLELNNQLAKTQSAYQPVPVLNSNKLEAEGIKLPEIHQALREAIHNLSLV